jgi:hypothetical protein
MRSSAADAGTPLPGAERSMPRSCAVSASADCCSFFGSAPQTRAISPRMSTKPGRPQREEGGK